MCIKCSKGKNKLPLEIWTGKKPKLNYFQKFGCVADFYIPKMTRNKFGKHSIMLGYSRERIAHGVYDLENKKVIEEQLLKFNELLKGSSHLGKKR